MCVAFVFLSPLDVVRGSSVATEICLQPLCSPLEVGHAINLLVAFVFLSPLNVAGTSVASKLACGPCVFFLHRR